MRRALAELPEAASRIGQAGLDLARAETQALTGDLKGSGRTLLRIILLFAGSLFLLFWSLALAAYAAVEVAGHWLPRWAAALVVFSLLLLFAAVMGWLAWRKLHRLETPAATVRRRVADHVGWWQRRLPRPQADSDGEKGGR